MTTHPISDSRCTSSSPTSMSLPVYIVSAVSTITNFPIRSIRSASLKIVFEKRACCHLFTRTGFNRNAKLLKFRVSGYDRYFYVRNMFFIKSIGIWYLISGYYFRSFFNPFGICWNFRLIAYDWQQFLIIREIEYMGLSTRAYRLYVMHSWTSYARNIYPCAWQTSLRRMEQ